jgi:hypothetical protein
MKKIVLLIITIAITWAANSQNMALQIMDEYSYFEVAEFTEFSTTDLTFEAWVKLDSEQLPQDYTAVVDGRLEDMSNSKSLSFKTVGGELKFFSEWEGSWTYEPEAGVNVVTPDEWQHLAVSVDGTEGTATFYLNGEEGAIITSDVYPNLGAEVTWHSLRIGNANHSLTATVIGLIDEVRIWTVARTASEIADNMNKEIDPETTGLLAYYRCNEEPGNTILRDELGENDAVTNGDQYDFVDADWPGAQVSIKNNTIANVSVFPNPVKNTLNIKGMELINSDVNIYSITGQLIHNTVLKGSSIDVSNLNTGIYFIKINNNYLKFIKQ